MKKLREIITSKRGVAMELAVGVMLITVALGILLLSNATIQARKSRRAQDALDEKIAVMQMMEYVQSGEDEFDLAGIRYTVERAGDSIAVKNGENVVLEVELEGNQVKSWQKIEQSQE